MFLISDLQYQISNNINFSHLQDDSIIKQRLNVNSQVFYIFEQTITVKKNRPQLIIKINYLASISSIIYNHPELIHDKILFDVNDAHYYVVKFFIDGEWQYIVTDDKFPCENKRAIFARPHDNQIWVMLLQKCWAKVFGSYESIISGYIQEGFATFTGAPTQVMCVYQKKDQTKIQEALEKANQKKYVICLAGNDYLESLNQDEKQKIGLVSGHAYSFLRLFRIKQQIVVRLRNPWGFAVWKGDWSFQSTKWTKELRQQYNYNTDPKDGSFYISWTDLMKYFGQFQFCRVNRSYVNSSIKLKNQLNNSTCLKITVIEDGVYNLSVYQINKRKYKNNQNYQYSRVKVILYKDVQGKLEQINSIKENGRPCVNLQLNLNKGIYIICIKIYWRIKQVKDTVFSSYGISKLKLQQISKKQLINCYGSKFQNQIYKQFSSFCDIFSFLCCSPLFQLN